MSNRLYSLLEGAKKSGDALQLLDLVYNDYLVKSINGQKIHILRTAVTGDPTPHTQLSTFANVPESLENESYDDPRTGISTNEISKVNLRGYDTAQKYNQSFKFLNNSFWNAKFRSTKKDFNSLDSDRITKIKINNSVSSGPFNIKGNIFEKIVGNQILQFNGLTIEFANNFTINGNHQVTLNLGNTTEKGRNFNIGKLTDNSVLSTLTVNSTTTLVESFNTNTPSTRLTLQNLNRIIGASSFIFKITQHGYSQNANEQISKITINPEQQLATGESPLINNENIGSDASNYKIASTEFIPHRTNNGEGNNEKFFGFQEFNGTPSNPSSYNSFGHRNSQSYLKKENSTYTAYFPEGKMTSEGFLGLVPSSADNNVIINFIEEDVTPTIAYSIGDGGANVYTVKVPHFIELDNNGANVWQ